MKKLLLFVFCFIFLSSAAQLESSHLWDKTGVSGWAMLDLKGKVRSVRQTGYKADPQMPDGKGGSLTGEFSVNRNLIIEFDSIGRITKEIYFPGPDQWEDVHTYDAVKNTEMVFEDHFRNGWSKVVFSYDSQGRCLGYSSTQSYSDKSYWNTKYIVQLNEKGQRTASTFINGDGVKFKTHYKYNSRGQLISKEAMGDAGVIWSKEKYSYDAKGQRVREEYFIKDTVKPDHSFDLVYDPQGSVIKKEYQKPSEKIRKTFVYLFKYDEKGNWIRKEESENGIPKTVVEREFTYY